MWELCSAISILSSLAAGLKSKPHFMIILIALAVHLYYHSFCVCEAFILCNKFCLDLLFSSESRPTIHDQIAFAETEWLKPSPPIGYSAR